MISVIFYQSLQKRVQIKAFCILSFRVPNILSELYIDMHH